MVTHWESSSRPLFVKTVWKDGYRHVLLHKDEDVPLKPKQSSRRSISSGLSQKTTRKIREPHDKSAINFRLPSVKLLLAGLNGFKNEDRTKRSGNVIYYKNSYEKSAVTIDIIPGEHIKYKNINKEVVFDKTPKSSTSFDNDSICARNPPSFDQDHFNASLSDRVMVWLDLATHHQELTKNFKEKKRTVTAHACAITQRRSPPVDNNRKHFNYRLDRERAGEDEQSMCVEDGGQEISDGALKVTSRMEHHVVDDIWEVEEAPDNRRGTAKRQLHIFLPNLPNKSSDCDSTLSSKSSSLLVERK